MSEANVILSEANVILSEANVILSEAEGSKIAPSNHLSAPKPARLVKISPPEMPEEPLMFDLKTISKVPSPLMGEG